MDLQFNFKKNFGLAVVFLLGLTLFSPALKAETKDPITNPDVLCLPDKCQGEGLFEPDFNCIQKKIFNPSEDCCNNKCVGQESVAPPGEYVVLVSFFGGDIGIRDGQQIPTFINLAITTILGIISVYAIVMGIYTAAVVRANAMDEETIAQANKTLVTLIIGFILAWSFILIIQLVANFLGIGSLSNLQFTSTGGSNIVIG